FQQRFSVEELVRLALRGGADTIQFRRKTGTMRDKLAALEVVRDECHTFSIPLIVDDHLDLALLVDADGVHLGQEDIPISEARQLLQALPRQMIIGATVTTSKQAIEAERDGADYLGFGPVFETSSKENPAPVKGLEGLRDATTAVHIPVVAIAGVTLDRVQPVLAAGAHGVAVMTAISTAENPEHMTRKFCAEIERVESEIRRTT
ncbi:MAG: thiamine phosphate synthase, partial [Rubricoccaceae bacterium]|nr:thiamine phosphate synthase [Rubricoccaceae bacterium]